MVSSVLPTSSQNLKSMSMVEDWSAADWLTLVTCTLPPPDDACAPVSSFIPSLTFCVPGKASITKTRVSYLEMVMAVPLYFHEVPKWLATRSNRPESGPSIAMRMPVGEPPFPDENEAGAASFFAELLLEGELAVGFFSVVGGGAGGVFSPPTHGRKK